MQIQLFYQDLLAIFECLVRITERLRLIHRRFGFCRLLLGDPGKQITLLGTILLHARRFFRLGLLHRLDLFRFRGFDRLHLFRLGFFHRFDLFRLGFLYRLDLLGLRLLHRFNFLRLRLFYRLDLLRFRFFYGLYLRRRSGFLFFLMEGVVHRGTGLHLDHRGRPAGCDGVSAGIAGEIPADTFHRPE